MSHRGSHANVIDTKRPFQNQARGGRSIGCETLGHSVVWKEDTRRCPSTWSKCQHLAAGGRRRQVKAGKSMTEGQNNTCDGQQAPAQALGHFCSYLGWQRGFSRSVVCLESLLLLPFLLFQALQPVLSVPVTP